jgi:hypothetical protein
MDKVQKPISLIQQPSSEPFRILSVYDVHAVIFVSTDILVPHVWPVIKQSVHMSSEADRAAM